MRHTSTAFTNIPPQTITTDEYCLSLLISPTDLQLYKVHPATIIMADTAMENPANTVPPHKKQLPSSIPNFDTLEGFSTEGSDDYSTFKKLQRQLEFVALRHMEPQVANSRRYIHLQEEYIKDEQRSLKRELVRAQEEIKRIQSVPLVIGQFMEAIDQK